MEMERVEPTKRLQRLAESIRCLLGIQSHLTSNWVDSVQNIIKNLPPSEGSTIEDWDNRDATSRIEDEHVILTAYIYELNVWRRRILNDLLDLKGNIRVFCRVRPITVGENFGALRPVVVLDSSTFALKFSGKKHNIYKFDKVFEPGSSQDEIFSEVEPVIKSALEGYNACIFAYGQTGTGKTFTMEGTPDCPGLIPRAIAAFFKQAEDSNHTFLFKFSMLEIYLGNLKDLLVSQATKMTDPMPPSLIIRTDSNGGIEIENLVTVQVSALNQAMRLYRYGCNFRSTASTNSNRLSSRSHCMIRLSLSCSNAPERRRETSKIWMVDLGGSERIVKTNAWGRRLEEGKAINLSLSALGDVIAALQRKKGHIPYRNSKLTQVLKDSLGNDSKMLMLVHVSSRAEDLCETTCSLNFATRVSSIHLGKKEESTEARAEKDVQIANLQQKMKWIEDKCKQISREIKRLNNELDNLTGATPSSYEESDTSYQFEEKQPTADNMKIPPSYIANLPRFMRSTICSRRRKSEVNHQATDLTLKRKKKSALRLTESISLPINNTKDCKSESSASRISLWTSSKPKFGTDNDTEYSQEKSETDTLMSEFSAKSIRTSSKNDKFEIKPHLQKMENAHTNYRHRNKRVMAIPNPENRRRTHEQLPVKYDKKGIENVPVRRLIQCKTMSKTNHEEKFGITEILSTSEYNSYTTSLDTLNCLIYKNDDNGALVKQSAYGTISREDYLTDNPIEPSSASNKNSSNRNIENEMSSTVDQKNSVRNAEDTDKEAGKPTYDSISVASSSWISIVNERIKILHAIVLLGLGFQDLGLHDDFFHALVH